MEGELGSGARIAIALIVVGVIIGIIFVILGFTRGATNQGVTSVQNAMDQMNSSVFDDYDQQVLSGTQVSAALKLFEGRPVGMIVITSLSAETTATDGGYGINYGALFAATYGWDTTADTDATRKFHILTCRGSSPVTSQRPFSLVKNSGESYYTQDLKNTDGKLTYNMQTLQTKNTGTNEYIRPTAKFLSELIKDKSGTVTGICFTQQKIT